MAGPLAIHGVEAESRVFGSDEDIPPAVFRFEGARGSVRVTLEVGGVGVSGEPATSRINDVSFRAEGDGTIGIEFRRPWPGHDEGRVTVRCRSGREDSAADFEPELWFRRAPAIVTFESRIGDPTNPVAEGRDVVLARYAARNIAKEIRLEFKANFGREAVEPRLKPGPKPPR